jgi:hypothetical protein
VVRRCNTLILLVTAVLFVSCSVFETRNPEAPAQTSANYNPPVNASDVFDNMQFAFQDLNTVNYLKSFSDSATAGRTFQFDPSPQARSQYIGVFLIWTIQSEQQYFDNMRSKIPSGTSASLTFTLNPISIQSDSAQYDADYQLSVPHTQTNIPKIFQGRAQFFLIKDPTSSTWSIWHWIDFRDAQNDVGWSDLKGAFAQ